MSEIKLEYYLSSQALESAKVNLNLCQEIINDDLDLKNREIDIKYCTFGLNAIINSAIFIEAYINEFISEIRKAQEPSIIVNSLGLASINRVKKVTKINQSFLERDNVLDKYNLVLVLLDKEEFVRGEDPYQSVDLLFKFRNYLVHYKVETIDILKEESTSIEKQLNHRFSLHPLVINSNDLETKLSTPFPKSHISHNSAKWAIETSEKFTKSFFNKIGYQPFRY